jgi:hypothetical protein
LVAEKVALKVRNLADMWAFLKEGMWEKRKVAESVAQTAFGLGLH